jgi:hypothetical protein
MPTDDDAEHQARVASEYQRGRAEGWRSRAEDAGAELSRLRHYCSTACHHELHDQCRRTCKFCAETCRCECHDGGETEATRERPRG